MTTKDKAQNKVTLIEPITRGEQTISNIQVRVPRAGELRGLALSELAVLDVTSLKTLLPRISSPSLTESDIDNLHPSDLVALGKEVIAFLGQSQQE